MKILSIETSCDETGIAVVEVQGNTVTILGNALSSQIDIHAEYGGVFPALAKRAHAEKITPLLQDVLDQAFLLDAAEKKQSLPDLSFLDEKETQLRDHIIPFLTFYKKPDIDYIAVTVGPGLEPALWVGINTARVLSMVWNIPIIPINHMEGHIVTAAITEVLQPEDFSGPRVASEGPLNQTQKNLLAVSNKEYQISNLAFPALSLLVSGGHTELVLVNGFGKYQKIGQTRDDAVGEAFDKVARMIDLPYPGGPAISKLAKEFREKNIANTFELPRPMMHSGDFDFSFSGIKTAALYAIRDHKEVRGELSDDDKAALAAAFEDAAIEVLVHKTIKAASEHQVQTIIVGGGVAANSYLREQLIKKVLEKIPDIHLLFPEAWLATDNAIMIGLAAATRLLPNYREGGQAQVINGKIKTRNPDELRADGNLSL